MNAHRQDEINAAVQRSVDAHTTSIDMLREGLLLVSERISILTKRLERLEQRSGY